MAEITKPIALDETFNTTEGTSRNIADVLAQGIGDLVTVVSRISHQTTYDELSDLEDVNISAPTNGDVLTYDGSKWTNGQGGGGASVEQMIAPVETSTTASQAYAIGEQFILNGTLYTATAAITAGGTIVVDGNCTASDSVTEQIANAKDVYSETEHVVGKWVDGSTIYEKTVNFGSCPNSTSKTVAHGITNISRWVEIQAVMQKSGGSEAYPLMLDTRMTLGIVGANIQMQSTGNFSAYDAYVTLRYTKTS